MAKKRLNAIGRVLKQARQAAIHYKQLTGKPIGITGEVGEYEAARILGLTLSDARQAGFDARKGRRRIEIKSRVIGPDAKSGQRIGKINLDKEFDSVVLVLLNPEFQPFEIHKANRKAVEKALTMPGSKARNQRGQLSVSKFKSIGRLIWSR